MHQPNYLPWLGYFDKMRQADVFVLLDAVQYPRGRSVANRNSILTAQGELLLTVPVSVPRGREGKATYLEVGFADDSWRKKHLRSLEQAYARAPHFERFFPALREIVSRAETFCGLTISLVRRLAEGFGIETPTPRLSELGLEEAAKSELAIGLCERLGADVYLSGTGARAYNDPDAFAAAGIELRYQEFEHPVYPQPGAAFVPGLAAVDLLFNCGRWMA
jgi:hypothetical protein